MGRSRLLVGTSSWADPGFVEEWYPRGLAARDRLPYYAERFEAVEVNSTFYAVPGRSTVERWVKATPERFCFDVKLHRLLSRHSAQLNSLPPDLRSGARTTGRGRVVLERELERALVEATLEAVEPLAAASRLGGFLLQLTPGFAPQENDLDELAGIVERLAPHAVAIELRHRGWVSGARLERTLEWFEQARAAWVCVDAPRRDHVTIMPPVDAVTHPEVAYFRAHGRNAEGYVRGRSVAERFGWKYSDGELAEIRGRVKKLGERAGQVRTYFNNNRGSDAPLAATRLRELLGQRAFDKTAA